MAETYNFEDRVYIEPTVSRDEQLGFIDRLREIENKDLQKIATDTHNLGTDVPSNLGGLSAIGTPNSLGISGADTGSAGIWRNRYERPQVNALVQGLKATAQASALNDAMNNMLGQWKNRYNQAARRYNKSGGSNSADSSDPFKVKIGDDYQEALSSGKLSDNWSGGSLYVMDKDGTIHSTINVQLDPEGRIGGVDTAMQSYVGKYDTSDGSNPAKSYLDSLINNGYMFVSPEGQLVKLNTGE